LEHQAKERLTGGVILVVVLVLLVPELLTGPRPVLPPVAAQPDQAPMRSYTMDLGDSSRASRGPVAASTTAPPPTAPPPVIEPPAASSAPVRDTRTPPTPPAPAAPARTAALPAPRAAVAAPAPAHSSAAWTVQLGTFSSRDNAARLVAGLKSHGFGATISEATKNGHKLFRVRVGAERDRAAAQKLQGRLKAAGEKGGEIVPR
jgi:cell division septation protein DedD